MTEIVFLIEDDVDGGYTAHALGESIFTQAEDIENLREVLWDAVRCHFPDEQMRPKVIRLHIEGNSNMANNTAKQAFSKIYQA